MKLVIMRKKLFVVADTSVLKLKLRLRDMM